MIGFLSGIVKFKEGKTLIIEVNGVGYQVFTPAFVQQKCQINDRVKLLVYTHVRENEISLFGFINLIDKQTFVQLLSVSGIGPKLALEVLSSSKGSNSIIKAIQEADVEFFQAIKGLGKKSAQRVIVDLKAKIGGLKDLDFETEQDFDLLNALKGLGFSKEEIKKALKGMKSDLPLEVKIKQALKKISE